MYSAHRVASAILRPSQKIANSEITSPREHPEPQWLTSIAMLTHRGLPGSAGSALPLAAAGHPLAASAATNASWDWLARFMDVRAVVVAWRAARAQRQ